MVLSPLPVAARTILIAKVSANAAVLGLAILTLNVASGVVWPLILGAQPGPALGSFQSLPAWWLTIVAASAVSLRFSTHRPGIHGAAVAAAHVSASLGGSATRRVRIVSLRLLCSTVNHHARSDGRT
jgi:hypothetical protein